MAKKCFFLSHFLEHLSKNVSFRKQQSTKKKGFKIILFFVSIWTPHFKKGSLTENSSFQKWQNFPKVCADLLGPIFQVFRNAYFYSAFSSFLGFKEIDQEGQEGHCCITCLFCSWRFFLVLFLVFYFFWFGCFLVFFGVKLQDKGHFPSVLQGLGVFFLPTPLCWNASFFDLLFFCLFFLCFIFFRFQSFIFTLLLLLFLYSFLLSQ